MSDIKAIKGTNGTTYNLRDDYSVWGGENLLSYSDVYCYNTAQNAYFDKTNYIKSGIVTYARPAQKNEGFYITNNAKYELNTPYIVHFDVQDTANAITDFFIYKNGAAMGIQTADSAVWIDGVYADTFDVTINCLLTDGSKHHIDCYFTPTAESTSTYKGLILQLFKGTTTAFNATISNLKWEKGHKATDWSPCYKDIWSVSGTQLIYNL